jgi:2-keto-3-deoxy-galactonokinase
MLMKKSKKTGLTDKLSAEQAHAILSEFFIGSNLLHAKSIFYEWHEAGFSAQGSLKIVFSEML